MAESILIVGAGIVGLSTAYDLTKRGFSVTVIERGPIPCPLASSSDHHRLIRHVYGDAEGYCARIADAFLAWHRMWADLPGPVERYYADTGVLALSAEAGDYTDRSRAVMARLGIPFEAIDRSALGERFPFLDTEEVSYGLLSEGGALWANTILFDLAAWLRRHGAVLREQSPVAEIDHARGTVVLHSGESIAADRIVVAAGVGTRSLVPALGNTLTPNRSLVVYADVPADLAAVWAAAPCWTELGGETDLWGMPPLNGLPMKLGNASMGREDPEDIDRDISPEEIADLVESYRPRFRGTDRFIVRWGAANYWTLAPEQRFYFAEIDRSLVVSACSGHGFKFGALTGADVARAVAGDSPVRDVARDMAA